MRPDLPWNIAGISTEAREAARAAARREGLSVGEWLTRRIVSGLSDMSEPRHDWSSRSEYRIEPERHRRDSDAMLERVSKSETETAEVYRRIEDQLRNMARRLDASERSQSETGRVMSKAAVEMNITAREQAQAFDQLGTHVSSLTERLDRVENRETGDGVRDAVKALHQGLSRLADQITETANQSAAQISNLANNLETVAGRVTAARQDASAATQALETRLGSVQERMALLETSSKGTQLSLDTRVKTLENSAETNTQALERALSEIDEKSRNPQGAEAIRRLEDSVRRLEDRGSDPAVERRLGGIDRALADVMARLDRQDDHPLAAKMEDTVRRLMVRLEALEAAHAESAEALRKFADERAAEKQKAIEELPPHLQAQPAHAQPIPAQAIPVQAIPPQAAPAAFGPLPGYEPPPFPEPPPFVSPATQTPNYSDPLTSYELPADTFVPPQGDGAAPTTVESYLAAARRSARAAAQQEAERSSGLSNARWGQPAKQAAEPGKSRTRPVVVGLAAAILIVLIAGILFRQNANHQTPVTPESKPAVAKVAAVTAPPLHASVPEGSEQAPASDPSAVQGPLPVRTTALPPATGKPTPLPPQAAAPAPAAPQQAASLPPGKAPLDRLTQAANTGNAKAELIVGLKYLDGDGVPANDGEAAKWLAKAAEHGEPVAQYRMGTLFERGRGVPADAAKAARWYQAAAAKGNRKAMYNLAVAYSSGAGVAKDYAEASRWFLRAANLGLSDSQFNLAVLYERGLGVPQNLIDAYKWYAIAAAQGDAESKSRLAAISSQLDGEAKAAAQHAADSFKPGQLDARANVAPGIAEVVRG